MLLHNGKNEAPVKKQDRENSELKNEWCLWVDWRIDKEGGRKLLGRWLLSQKGYYMGKTDVQTRFSFFYQRELQWRKEEAYFIM